MSRFFFTARSMLSADGRAPSWRSFLITAVCFWDTATDEKNFRYFHKLLGVKAWRAVGLQKRETLENSAQNVGKVDRVLYDAPAKALPGGNGVTFQWDLLDGFDHPLPWALAGGLTPDNVGDAIARTGAPLVDTSSGVESAPGVKDAGLIRAFCDAVREADSKS